MYRIKAKDSEIKPYPLCLGNISNNLQSITWKNRAKKSVQVVSIDYNAIDTSYILGIHRYLMKKI